MNFKIILLNIGSLILYFALKIMQFINRFYREKPNIIYPDISRILVIDFGGIGDVILSTPVLRAIREKFPDSYISVLVWKNGPSEVLDGNPNVDEIIVSNSIVKMKLFEILNFINVLRKMRFDLTISTVTSYSREAAILSFLSNSNYRFGPENYKNNENKYKINYGSLNNFKILIDNKKHVIEQNLDLLKPLGIDKKNFDLDIFISDDDKKFCKEFIVKHGLSKNDILIGFHIGSGGQHWKRWDLKCFVRVADKLVNKYGARIIIFAGPFEIKLTEKMSYLMKVKPIIANDNTIKQTAAIIERCNFIISNDSALVHIAAAVKTKVIAIFGPTNFYWNAPYDKIHTVIRKDIPCSPCHITIGQTSPKCKKLDCLKLISEHDVLKELDIKIKDYIFEVE